MQMAIPIVSLLGDRVLFLGVGGGYDIMGSIPLFTDIPRWYPDKNDHKLLNTRQYSFANYNPISKGPEEALGTLLNKKVHVIPKTGVKKMAENIMAIVEEDQIDTIILIDGGVDALMRGDEEGSGTWLEDTVTMTAASQIPNVKLILACMGFGTELEEGLCHHHVLRNMADLMADDAFYGCCALSKKTSGYKKYKEACEYVWSNARKSHIHTKVISSVEGKFGNENLYDGVDAQVGGEKCVNYISPLMGIYWFFDLQKVVAKNRIAKAISQTNTSTDVLMIYRQMIDQLGRRSREPIPY